MSKYVHDTPAAKALSAWIILKGSHPIATVRAAYGSGGGVLVNIYQHGDTVLARTAKVLRANDPKLAGEDYQVAGFQSARASGYGYDKLTAALRGLVIDGVILTDHCSRLGAPKPPKGRKTFPRDYMPPKGYSLANFANGEEQYPWGGKHHPGIPDGEAGYTDCYREPGLNILKAKGYQVVQAL